MTLCPLCSFAKFTVFRNRVRFNIARDVLQCGKCDLVFLKPKKKDLKKFYAAEYRRLHSPVIGKRLNSKEIFDMYLPFQAYRLSNIIPYLKKNMRVLDIGCSSGHSLFLIKKRVKECIGIELNKSNARFVNKVLKIKAFTVEIEKTGLPKHYFDCILVLQTLEHLENPIAFLKSIRPYLKSNGRLFIETPNLNDALLSVYELESYKDFWFQEPHNFYFTPATLSKLLRRCGFKGEVKTMQSYNFLNHLNWLLLGRPQRSADIGMAIPKLIENRTKNSKVAKLLNLWFKRMDEEYKTILKKNQIGEFLLFTGKKI